MYDAGNHDQHHNAIMLLHVYDTLYEMDSKWLNIKAQQIKGFKTDNLIISLDIHSLYKRQDKRQHFQTYFNVKIFLWNWYVRVDDNFFLKSPISTLKYWFSKFGTISRTLVGQWRVIYNKL